MKGSKIMLITAGILLGILIAEVIYWAIIIGFDNLLEGAGGVLMFTTTGAFVFGAALEAVQKARQEGIADACKAVKWTPQGMGN